VVVLGMVAVLIAGCGGGTKTVTQTTESSPATEEAGSPDEAEGSVSLGGSEEAGYPSVEAVGKAVVADIEERYADKFESGECEELGFGKPPLYICEIKMSGEYHTIEATPHPDGTVEWVDSAGSQGELYEGDELTVQE
jgi:hypothetical protein